MSYKFIALEGLDGSGKTTIGKALAKAVRGRYMSTPSEVLGAARAVADDSQGTLETRFMFYLFAVCHASDCIRQTLTDQHVVCDRYLASTVAYHRALGLTIDWSFDGLGLVVPDASVLLVADEAERCRRMQARGSYTVSDKLTTDQEFRGVLSAEYEHWPHTKVDTTGKGVSDVVEEICRLTGLLEGAAKS